jgi:hypothetical protein
VNQVKWSLCLVMLLLMFLGCATAPTSHTAEQIPQMTDAQLIAEYQANVNQAYKSAANLQKINAQNDGTLGGSLATLIAGAPAAARGRSSILECQKLKIELQKRGYTVSDDGNVYQPNSQAQNISPATQAKEDVVR